MSRAETVTLSWNEVQQAAIVGVFRRIASKSKGLRDNHGFSGADAWTIDIEGAAGEMAVAKYLGLYWGGDINTFKSPDLPGQIQVRTTKEHSNALIVRQADNDNDTYVLVTGETPTFVLQGWITGAEAKKIDLAKRAPNGREVAWFVSSGCLNDMEELMRR